MEVRIPTPLRSYTGGESSVEVAGATVGEVLAELDRRYPGLRFRMVDEQDRIRRHMKVFVNEDAATGLDVAVEPSDVVTIMQALSGG